MGGSTAGEGLISTSEPIDEEELLGTSELNAEVSKQDELELLGTVAEHDHTNVPTDYPVPSDSSPTASIPIAEDGYDQSKNRINHSCETTEIDNDSLDEPFECEQQHEDEQTERVAGQLDSDVEMLEEEDLDDRDSLKMKCATLERSMRELRTRMRQERTAYRDQCKQYEDRIKELEEIVQKSQPSTNLKTVIKTEMETDVPTREVKIEMVVKEVTTVEPDIAIASSANFTQMRQRRSSSGDEREKRRERDTRKTESRTSPREKCRTSDRTEKKRDRRLFGPLTYGKMIKEKEKKKEREKESKKDDKKEKDEKSRHSRHEKRHEPSRSSRQENKENKIEKINWVHIRECRFTCKNCAFKNEGMQREMLLRALDRDKKSAPVYVQKTNDWIHVEDRWFFCEECNTKVEVIADEELENKKNTMEYRRAKRSRSRDRLSDRRRRRSRSGSRTRRDAPRSSRPRDLKRAHSKDDLGAERAKKQMFILSSQRAVDAHIKRARDFEKGSLRSAEDLSWEQKEKLALECLKSLSYEPRMKLICGLGHELPEHLEALANDPKTGHPWRKMRRDRLVAKEVLDAYTLEQREEIREKYSIKEPIADHVKQPQLSPLEKQRDNWFDEFENGPGPSNCPDSGSVSCEDEDDDEVYVVG